MDSSVPTMNEIALEGAVVVIPARGGSRGIPLKNLKTVGGVPLVTRAVQSCLATPGVGLVVVSTDHPQIAAEAHRAGAVVIDRPEHIAGDTASSESAVLHALDILDAQGPLPEVTVLVQATSPFIDSESLASAIARVTTGDADVVLSAVGTHSFEWQLDNNGAVPVGHELGRRPRRQELEPRFRETGGFYAMRTSGLQAAGTRFFGKIGLALVNPSTAIEIDEEADLALAQRLAITADELGETKPIPAQVLVTDFDGVHTDDAAWVDSTGVESVRVHRGDGLGISKLRSKGVPILILSTEQNPVVKRRAEKLQVESLQGISDKAAALNQWLSHHKLDPELVAYVGNDINDLPAMRAVGWPIAVADAHPDVLAAARIILRRTGGHGAVRETCDRILAALTSART